MAGPGVLGTRAARGGFGPGARDVPVLPWPFRCLALTGPSPKGPLGDGGLGVIDRAWFGLKQGICDRIPGSRAGDAEAGPEGAVTAAWVVALSEHLRELKQGGGVWGRGPGQCGQAAGP